MCLKKSKIFQEKKKSNNTHLGIKKEQNNRISYDQLPESIYSKTQFYFLKLNLTTTKREKLYSVIAMLLKVGSFNNAIQRILSAYQKNMRTIFGKPFMDPNQAIIDVLKDVEYRHKRLGMNSIDSIKPYIPSTELMILSSSVNLTVDSLTNASGISRKLNALRSMIIKSLISPLMYIIGFGGMLYIVNIGLRPALLMTGNYDKLPQSTKAMLDLSQNFVTNKQYYILILVLSIVGTFLIMKKISS